MRPDRRERHRLGESAEKDCVRAEQRRERHGEERRSPGRERERDGQRERDRAAPPGDRVDHVQRRGDRRGEHHRRHREQARPCKKGPAEPPSERGEAEDEHDQRAGAPLAREVRGVEPCLQLPQVSGRVVVGA